jgi:hypothetical protein
MLENARRGSCQQVRVKLEIEEERYAERSGEGGRRRGGEIEIGSKLKTSLARLRARKCVGKLGSQPRTARSIPYILDGNQRTLRSARTAGQEIRG